MSGNYGETKNLLRMAAASLRDHAIRELEEALDELRDRFDPENPLSDFRLILSTHVKRLEKILKTVECIEDMISELEFLEELRFRRGRYWD